MVLTFGNIWSPNGRQNNYGIMLADRINKQINELGFFKDAGFRTFLHDGLPPGTVELEIFLLLCRQG